MDRFVMDVSESLIDGAVNSTEWAEIMEHDPWIREASKRKGKLLDLIRVESGDGKALDAEDVMDSIQAAFTYCGIFYGIRVGMALNEALSSREPSEYVAGRRYR